MGNIEFDGKWTNEIEWKPTALFELPTENGKIYLRSAHQGNFIYFMIDAVPDTKVTSSDQATICFDTNNDKSQSPDDNDFCFSVNVNNDSGKTLNGNGQEFVEIKNHDGFVAVGTTSDHNDRYSKTPHASYEFKIPTDLVGRTDTYGFYFAVYDAQNNNYFWPTESSTDPMISPDKWGILISPDKSLPEFNIAFVILISSFLLIIFFTKNNFKLFSTLR